MISFFTKRTSKVTLTDEKNSALVIKLNPRVRVKLNSREL